MSKDIVLRNPHNTTPQFDGSLIMQGCQLVYKNFTGRETQYNREGDRNFAVVLDDVTAEELRKDDWNVKTKPSKDDPDENFNTLQVKIGTKGRPPQVYMITSRGRTKLEIDDLDLLDWAEFVNVDLKVGAYKWDIRGETGVTAYLRALYVTILEDELEQKYADVPNVDEKPAIDWEAVMNEPDGTPAGKVIQGSVAGEE